MLVKSGIYKKRIQDTVFSDPAHVAGECKEAGILVRKNEELFMIFNLTEEKIRELEWRAGKYSWKTLFEEYHTQKLALKQNIWAIDSQIIIDRIESCKPEIRAIYDMLGIEKIQELGYDMTKIRKEMKDPGKRNLKKLVDLFAQKIEYGNKEYTNKEINNIIRDICVENYLDKIPAIKMLKFFDYENLEKKKDGQRVKFRRRV